MTPSRPLHFIPRRSVTLLLLLLTLTVPIFATVAQEATPDATPVGDRCATQSDLGDAPDYHVGRGDAFFGQQDYTHAIEAYTCALQLDPNYLPGYINRGYAYAVQFNQPLALDDYNQALTISPESVAALNNRGMLYLAQGRFQQAIDDFDRVIELEPDNPNGYHNRAIVHASEGDYDLALADIEQALTLNPEFTPAYATRGAIYLALAAVDYAEYDTLTGRPASRQTGAGNPSTMLSLLQSDLANDGFTSWLALLTPIREATP